MAAQFDPVFVADAKGTHLPDDTAKVEQN